jgi:hypothetical protein
MKAMSYWEYLANKANAHRPNKATFDFGVFIQHGHAALLVG